HAESHHAVRVFQEHDRQRHQRHLRVSEDRDAGEAPRQQHRSADALPAVQAEARTGGIESTSEIDRGGPMSRLVSLTFLALAVVCVTQPDAQQIRVLSGQWALVSSTGPSELNAFGSSLTLDQSVDSFTLASRSHRITYVTDGKEHDLPGSTAPMKDVQD